MYGYFFELGWVYFWKAYLRAYIAFSLRVIEFQTWVVLYEYRTEDPIESYLFLNDI